MTTSCGPYLQAKRNEVHPPLSLSIDLMDNVHQTEMKFIHHYLWSLIWWPISIKSMLKNETFLCNFQTLWYVVANYCRIAIVEKRQTKPKSLGNVSEMWYFPERKTRSLSLFLAPLCLLSISRTWPVTLSAVWCQFQ